MKKEEVIVEEKVEESFEDLNEESKIEEHEIK